MASVNIPRIDITFLNDYDLTFNDFSSVNRQANTSSLNLDTEFAGKKGFHLCGGSVDDDTNEDSGCVLDGTYTFYDDNYDGWLGATYSDGKSGVFTTPESVVIKATNDGTYIKSLIVTFDSVANEYATILAFDKVVKADGSTDTRYTQNVEFKNNGTVFMYNFGEDSTIVSVRLNIKKWNKKNALVKVTRIKTGYAKQYSNSEIMSVKWDNFKVSEENELTFGISSNSAEIVVLDKDNILYSLYSKDLFYSNIQVNIYIDDILQGVYYLDDKNNERGSQEWTLSCVDAFEKQKDDICQTMQLTSNMTIKAIIEWVCSKMGIETNFTDEASATTTAFVVPQAYITSKQSYYTVLLKCCQVCCLRMYMAYGKLVVTSGL